MLGEQGERLTASRDFYAIFSTDDEWRLVSAGRTLGTIPISNPVGVGVVIAFAGRRWRTETVDDRGKVLEVVHHRSGKIPKFDNVMNEPVHDRLSAEVKAVLEDMSNPVSSTLRRTAICRREGLPFASWGSVPGAWSRPERTRTFSRGMAAI
jgi:ATP-dependent Lhr-like helicase